MSDALQQSRFRIGGMDCASCAAKVETAARRVAGVAEVDVSVTAGSMVVRHAPGASLPDLQGRIAGLGYTIAPAGGEDHAHQRHRAAGDGPWWRSAKARLVLASAVGLAAAYAAGRLVPPLAAWAFPLAMAIGLVPIARRAAMAALAGSPFTIETLMTVAALGALAIGAAEEGAVVIVLFLVGELLEGMAAGRARASIRALSALLPASIRVETQGGIVEQPAAGAVVGSVIQARPGDRIGADGEIVEGDSAIDESPVTGESVTVAKGPGARVFAGTINGAGLLRIRVTAAAADNTVSRIVRLVEEAQERKAPTERVIGRFSRWYTPAVLAAGVLVAVLPPLLAGAAWADWVYRGLALLLIGCPCALVISVPAALAAALAAGARQGLLLKGGAVVERLGRLTDIAFDKTGTLTEGRPVVTDILPLGPGRGQVLAMAAALEAGSSHPLATAILAQAEAEKVLVLPATEARALPGQGVEGRFGGRRLFLGSARAAAGRAPLAPAHQAQVDALQDEGKTVAVLLREDRPAAIIALRDEPRPDARPGLAALRGLGLDTVMLTGDTAATARAIAASLGIKAHAGLLPADKQRIIRDMQAAGRRVGKVGDGINDAPALAAADIGIAMGGGTDVALEAADAAVLHGRVLDVARMVRLSRAAMANIRQNIAIALGLKAVFLVTTLAGLTGLWPAILADTGATVLVTANAMRLLAWRG